MITFAILQNKRDDRVRATMKCDDCGAKPGEMCIGARGERVKTVHWVRRHAFRDQEMAENRAAKKAIKQEKNAPVTVTQLQEDLSLRPGHTASEALRRLCLRHAKVGRCILCGRGPFVAISPWGACKHCMFATENDVLKALVGM